MLHNTCVLHKKLFVLVHKLYNTQLRMPQEECQKSFLILWILPKGRNKFFSELNSYSLFSVTVQNQTTFVVLLHEQCCTLCLYRKRGYDDDEEEEEEVQFKVQIYTLMQFSTQASLAGEL